MFRFPYLSIDIETTGTDLQRAHVLQLAAVYDTGAALDELPTFNVVIKWDELHYINEWALRNNFWLLEHAWTNEEALAPELARAIFDVWLSEIQPEGRFTAAGKNVVGFDTPILKNPVNQFEMRRFLHRALDPGSMYTEDFDHVPTLGEINKLIGRDAVAHDALGDAWDVVYAIRQKWGV